MTIERMIELLKIEHECMLRKSHDDCNGDCNNCDLVQDDGELHEMYMDVIGILKAQEPRVMELTELSDCMIGWLEYMDEVLPVISGTCADGAHCFIDTMDRNLALKDVDYNVVWRVWTLKPTQAQRGATPWMT